LSKSAHGDFVAQVPNSKLHAVFAQKKADAREALKLLNWLIYKAPARIEQAVRIVSNVLKWAKLPLA
jgi:hypothetical protein